MAHADPSSTSPEQGYDLGAIQSPRSLGFGGAQTALGASTTALYDNPANLTFTRVYHFEALATISPEARRQSFGGAIIDSNTSRLAGGIGYTYSLLDPDGIHRSWNDLRLALAYPLGDKISIGVAGRYLRVNQSIASGPLGSSRVSDGTNGGPLFNAFSADIGAAVMPTTGLRFGLVGKNLSNPGTGLAPTLLQGGVGYFTDIFSIVADGLADFTTWSETRARFMIGGEAFIANHFPLRAGYRYDDGTRVHSVSAGAGYVDKRWSFELSGRRDVAGDHPMTMISAALRYFYEAGPSPADEGEQIGY
jgi:hypothetical protein